MNNPKWNWQGLNKKIKCFDIEAKTLLFETESSTEAGKLSGVSEAHIYNYIKTKCKCYKNKYNKPICFR